MDFFFLVLLLKKGCESCIGIYCLFVCVNFQLFKINFLFVYFILFYMNYYLVLSFLVNS